MMQTPGPVAASHGAVWGGLGSRHPRGFPVPPSPPQAESCTHGLPEGFPSTSCSSPENVGDSLTGGWTFPPSAGVPPFPPTNALRSHGNNFGWSKSDSSPLRPVLKPLITLPGNGSLNFRFVIPARLAALSSETAPGDTRVLRASHQCCPDCGVSLRTPPCHLLFPPSSLGIPPAAFGVKLLISAVTAESGEPPAWLPGFVPFQPHGSTLLPTRPIPVAKNTSGGCRGRGGTRGEASGLGASHAPAERCAHPGACTPVGTRALVGTRDMRS